MGIQTAKGTQVQEKNYVEFNPEKFRGALLSKWVKVEDEMMPLHSPLQVSKWVSWFKEKAVGISNEGKENEKYYLNKQSYSDVIGKIKNEVGKDYEKYFQVIFQNSASTIKKLPQSVRKEGDSGFF